MPSIASLLKALNRQQSQLRLLLDDPARFGEGIPLLLRQHTALHAARMSGTGESTIEDLVLAGLSDEELRRLPPASARYDVPHSLAWLVWHSTRCEDITMNLLVAGSPQVLESGSWLPQLKIETRDTANAMTPAELQEFNLRVHLPALLDYRVAVGRRTQAIVSALQPTDLRRKVPPERIQRVWDEGAVLPAARQIVDYWSRRDTAGLLLMPATRHHLAHWNEALEIKKALRRR